MMKVSLAALALGGCLLSVSGCELVKSLSGKKGASNDEAEVDAEKGEKKTKKKGERESIEGCELPEGSITADVTIKKGCKVEVSENLTVSGGAVVTIEAGATLAFAAERYLAFDDAKLVVKGTEKEPVVFTSSNRSKAKGDWIGVFLQAGTMSGTRIEHARFEYAGREASGGNGALTISDQSTAKRISIVGSVFENNERAAVWISGEKAGFAEFSGNRFEKNGRSLVAPAHVLGSIGAGNRFGDPIETKGDVSETTTWPAFGVPVYVSENLRVQGSSSAPTLTLTRGTELRFAPSTYFSVGEDKGGSLVAPGCTFTSANETPSAGDWVGFFFYKNTQRVDLSGASIDAAGHDGSGGRAAITFYDVDAKDARNVTLTGLTVKNSRAAALASPNNDCASLAAQITASGLPVCRAE
jgi:hypothetical protein